MDLLGPSHVGDGKEAGIGDSDEGEEGDELWRGRINKN